MKVKLPVTIKSITYKDSKIQIVLTQEQKKAVVNSVVSYLYFAQCMLSFYRYAVFGINFNFIDNIFKKVQLI